MIIITIMLYTQNTNDLTVCTVPLRAPYTVGAVSMALYTPAVVSFLNSIVSVCDELRRNNVIFTHMTRLFLMPEFRHSIQRTLLAFVAYQHLAYHCGSSLL